MKIVFTSALINNEYATVREKEYRMSLEQLHEFGYDVFLIETLKSGPPSFFEHYTNNIFYSNTNVDSLRNIGVKETMALIGGLKYYNFNASPELILKLTGRYLINRKSFLEQLTESESEYDVVATTDVYGQVFFGCFAMRGGLFYEMLTSFDLCWMEKNMINIEWITARYIDRPRFKVNYLKSIGVSANIANSGITTYL